MRWWFLLLAPVLAIAIYCVAAKLAGFSAPSGTSSTGVVPLEITVSMSKGSDTDQSIPGLAEWTPKPKIPFYVRYKNVSQCNIILSQHTYSIPDIHFSSISWFVKSSNTFITDDGELCWWLIKPGETVTTVHDLGIPLIFRISGSYNLNYLISAEGRFYKGALPVKADGFENKLEGYTYSDHAEGNFTAYAAGKLHVPITSAHSSWGW